MQIKENNKSVDYKIENNKIVISTKADTPRKYSYSINIDGAVTHCNILVLPCLYELAKNRCHFIAENQQYNNPKSKLDGAYLIYDNEEKHIYYNREYDFNGGRERVGMGVLIAKYLQNHDDEVLLNSLKKYIKYVQKPLFASKPARCLMTAITIIPLPAFTIIRGSACFILNFTNCLGDKNSA